MKKRMEICKRTFKQLLERGFIHIRMYTKDEVKQRYRNYGNKENQNSGAEQ